MSTTHIVEPGDSVVIGSHHPECPPDIRSFLGSRGWQMVHTGMGNTEGWQHSSKTRATMTWEQAMACEFYEFITLGGK